MATSKDPCECPVFLELPRAGLEWMWLDYVRSPCAITWQSSGGLQPTGMPTGVMQSPLSLSQDRCGLESQLCGFLGEHCGHVT